MSTMTKNPLQRFEDHTLDRCIIMTPPCTRPDSEEFFVSPELNVVSLLGLYWPFNKLYCVTFFSDSINP